MEDGAEKTRNIYNNGILIEQIAQNKISTFYHYKDIYGYGYYKDLLWMTAFGESANLGIKWWDDDWGKWGGGVEKSDWNFVKNDNIKLLLLACV